MSTNKWKIEELVQNEIYIVREQDNIPIFKMISSVEDGDELLNHDEAIDVAQQIVDSWNFSCEELE
jgi:DNA replication protein DnaC